MYIISKSYVNKLIKSKKCLYVNFYIHFYWNRTLLQNYSKFNYDINCLKFNYINYFLINFSGILENQPQNLSNVQLKYIQNFLLCCIKPTRCFNIFTMSANWSKFTTGSLKTSICVFLSVLLFEWYFPIKTPFNINYLKWQK